jgi:hypothetical protein
LENNISAIDVGAHIKATRLFKVSFEVTHLDETISANIDPTQKRDVCRTNFTFYMCLTHSADIVSKPRTERLVAFRH